MDSSRTLMYAALLLAVAVTVSAAPQFSGDGFGGGFPPRPGRPGPPVYYDDEEEDSSEDELTFFQRLVRPWRWFDPVYNFFAGSGSDDEEEVYDEGNFPGRFPGQQVARLDQRQPVGPPPQRYVARPAAPLARSDPVEYRPDQRAAEALRAEQERPSSR
ncbi:hypothetical protein FJT64_020193 [Amphibalanus amphitrite]|uniref:Uncharacterized protein n=1 Tax=Amphibalanus amphitrite TaxID=1232801 RepID=A0A6A4WXH3_AMPAM|nr:hypothetical protein FJT64_020193 [Amphibalanus amphitrite]